MENKTYQNVMATVKICRERGHKVYVRGDELVIDPIPNRSTLDCDPMQWIVDNKPIVITALKKSWKSKQDLLELELMDVSLISQLPLPPLAVLSVPGVNYPVFFDFNSERENILSSGVVFNKKEIMEFRSLYILKILNPKMFLDIVRQKYKQNKKIDVYSPIRISKKYCFGSLLLSITAKLVEIRIEYMS